MVNFLIFVSVLIVIDIVTGLLGSLKNGDYSSSRMRQGLISKTGEIFAVGFMIVLEYGLPKVGVQTGIPFVGATSTYIILMEIGSIFENLTKVNDQLATVLEPIFAQVKRKVGEEDED